MRIFGAYIVSVILIYFCVMSFITLISEGVEVFVAFLLSIIALGLYFLGFALAERGDEL